MLGDKWLETPPSHCRPGTRNLHYYPADGRGQTEGGKQEPSAGSAAEMVRMHQVPRTELFTLLRVPGAPRAAQLTPARITRGRFIDSGEEFQIVDCWTRRDGGAHKHLGRKWVGTTTFWRKSPEQILVFQLCSRRIFAKS